MHASETLIEQLLVKVQTDLIPWQVIVVHQPCCPQFHKLLFTTHGNKHWVDANEAMLTHQLLQVLATPVESVCKHTPCLGSRVTTISRQIVVDRSKLLAKALGV